MLEEVFLLLVCGAQNQLELTLVQVDVRVEIADQFKHRVARRA